MPTILHKTGELCFEVDHAQSIKQVRRTLKRAAKIFGTSFFFMLFRSGKSIPAPVQLVGTNCPERFQQYYDQQRVIGVDPIVMSALTTRGVFRWDGKHLTERKRILRRERIACDIEFGFSCTDHGPDGSQLLLCFCGSTPIAPDPEDWDKTTSASMMLASLTHRTLIRLARRGAAGDAEKPRLTVAEFQALQLTASAMTAKQVATKLGVKPETVRYYLSRAAEKLGAASRREAVTKALEKGLIDTRTFSTVGFSDRGVF